MLINYSFPSPLREMAGEGVTTSPFNFSTPILTFPLCKGKELVSL
jgi:hypothetical protein